MTSPRLNVNQVLQAAAQAFARQGYDGMSMRQLAESCAVTAPALYHHFSSKEALYDEVCRRLFDDLLLAMDRALKDVHTPEARIDRFVTSIFHTWQDSTLLVLTQRDVINAAISPERSYASPYYRLLYALIAKIQPRNEHGAVDDGRTFAFAAILYGFCSLMVFSSPQQGQSLAAHRLQRKDELLLLCRELMLPRVAA